MSSAHLSTAAVDPYQWRESVLSTRSLSYLSTADALGSPGLPHSTPPPRTSSTNLARPPVRRETMTDDSDYSLEMLGGSRNRELDDIPELPDSVANSALFTLPRDIRDRVYIFCLMADNGVPLEWPTSFKAYILQPQLLRTCKIIYDEAAPLLYTLNNMTFHHPSDANMFVRAISAPSLSRHISNLSLHIRAQDTRLWMPYLSSKDINRSLRSDFPALRELGIRFRSNKWQHALTPEANMKLWSEDSRLDEIIDSLRHVLSPDGTHEPKNAEEFEAYISNRPDEFPLDPSDPSYKKQWLDIHKARAAFTANREATPTIRVLCACRVHSTHFTALTTGNPAPNPQPAAAAGNAQQAPLSMVVDPSASPPAPVQEGEPFRGFTPVDLRGGMKKLHDPDLGSANVARTPYADRNGVLLSLEIHCLDPKRDNTAEQRTV